MIKKIIFYILFVTSIVLSNAQESDKAAFFVEPEAHFGFVVPNYSAAPNAGNVYSGSLSIGFQTKKDSSWQAYYGFPQTGVQFSYLHIENQEQLGSQYALNPFIVFNRPFGEKHSLDFKLGLGIAYHTAPFDSLSNPLNLAIGSPLSWFFNANAYYRYALSKRIHLKIGGGFWHASNGHTTLPNFGQNYGMFGLGVQYYPSQENPTTKFSRSEISKDKYYFLRITAGVGLHEFGGTSAPLNGPKYQVTSTAVAFGALFRKYLLVKTGVAYQYYSSYADSQVRKEFADFEGNKTKAASNVFLFLGTELLFGHVSLDVQGGLNLWKPYFSHFYDKYEPRSNFDKTMKVLFNTRVGVNFYALNTAKNPKHNISVGAFLNANYGQADYTSFLFNYALRLN